MDKAAILGAGLGFVLVLYWRTKNRKAKAINMVLLTLYYLAVVQLMLLGKYFHG